MTDDLRGFRPQHPGLYQLAADGRSLEFLYVQCPACAKLSFPANVPGCAHCGDALQDAGTEVGEPGRQRDAEPAQHAREGAIEQTQR